MNLYRSFANLLETTTVAEDVQSSAPREGVGLGSEGTDCIFGDSTMLSGRTQPSKTDLGTLPWSESEDSGLEMASSETPMPSPVCSGGSTDTDQPTSGREEDLGSWSSPPLSPDLRPPSSSSSSSQSLSLRVQSPLVPQAIHLKLEQALERTDTERWRGIKKDPQLPGDQALWRRCHSASLPKQRATAQIHKTDLRSGSLGPRRKANPAAVCQQVSERHRRAMSLYLDTLPVQTDPEGEGDKVSEGLSPGLGYLEQVCRMLEEIAMLQIRNRALQMEVDALREPQAEQESQTTSESHQCASKNDDEDEPSTSPSTSQSTSPSTSPRLEANHLEDISSHLPLQIDVFRQRSASDTHVLGGHLRKHKMTSRGRYLSAEDLMEQAEDEEKIKEIKKKPQFKSKTLKLGSWTIGSLKRGESAHLSDIEKNSQQMHSSMKKANRPLFGQLFRRRKKTVPA